MNTKRLTVAPATVVLFAPAFTAVCIAEEPVKLITASFWGTGSDDSIQGAAAGPDGTLYIVGSAGAPLGELPGGVKSLTLGTAEGKARSTTDEDLDSLKRKLLDMQSQLDKLSKND